MSYQRISDVTFDEEIPFEPIEDSLGKDPHPTTDLLGSVDPSTESTDHVFPSSSTKIKKSQRIFSSVMVASRLKRLAADFVERGSVHSKRSGYSRISRRDRASFLTRHLGEKKTDMTIDRRFAVWLSQFRWYNSHKQTEDMIERGFPNDHSSTDYGTSNSETLEIPDIRKSWTFFEHFILPRYIVSDPHSNQRTHKKARLGENYKMGTKLYPVFATTIDDLSEFGVGTALYFRTVRALAIITGVAGLINIYLMIKYAEVSGMELNSQNYLYYGSAFCNNTETVNIETFVYSDDQCKPEYDQIDDRRIPFHHSYNKTTQTCQVIKNNCVPDFFSMGIVHYVTMIFLSIAMYYFFFIYQNELEIKYDEDNLTASDYTVQVENPPKNAIDPEEWRAFFTKFSEKFVHSCTIVINNEDLVKDLVRRRILHEKLKLCLPGVDIKDIKQFEALKPKIRKEVTSLLKKLEDIKERIVELSKDEKIVDVNQVFVTFETERGKRRALKALSYGHLERTFNSKTIKFMGKVLKVSEPTEPTAIRWDNLDESLFVKIRQQFFSILFSLLLIGVGGYLIYFINLHLYWKQNTSYFITFFNILIPMFCRIANSYESFEKEGDSQRSLYFKIALARWVNTVLVYFAITPFIKMNSLLELVSSLFLAEMLINPLYAIFDPFNIYYKHIAGPRAKNQAKMNSYFIGTNFSLAERYTSLTKILFLCFFYATILPASYLFCSISLWITFYVDKYLLLRRWGQAPASGPSVAQFSRNSFLTTALIMHFIMSAYWWSGFPFDNVSEYDGKYYAVNQNLYDSEFPAYPEDQNKLRQPKGIPEDWIGWMSAKQEEIVSLTGISSAVLLGVVVFLVFFKKVFLIIKLFFTSYHEPQGKNRGIDYSNLSNSENTLYIPELKNPNLLFPVLACNISNIEPNYIGWEDPDDKTNYDKHNLVSDLKELGVDVDGGKQLFSIVKQWKRP